MLATAPVKDFRSEIQPSELSPATKNLRRWRMTTRGALTWNTALLSICTILLTFFAYASGNWISYINGEIKDLRRTDADIMGQVNVIKAEERAHWDEVMRSLTDLRKTLDHIDQKLGRTKQ